jgi:hypothetical protein
MNAIRLDFSVTGCEALAKEVKGRMMSRNGKAIATAVPFNAARRDIAGKRVTRRWARIDVRTELLSQFGFDMEIVSLEEWPLLYRRGYLCFT